MSTRARISQRDFKSGYLCLWQRDLDSASVFLSQAIFVCCKENWNQLVVFYVRLYLFVATRARISQRDFNLGYFCLWQGELESASVFLSQAISVCDKES